MKSVLGSVPCMPFPFEGADLKPLEAQLTGGSGSFCFPMFLKLISRSSYCYILSITVLIFTFIVKSAALEPASFSSCIIHYIDFRS